MTKNYMQVMLEYMTGFKNNIRENGNSFPSTEKAIKLTVKFINMKYQAKSDECGSLSEITSDIEHAKDVLLQYSTYLEEYLLVNVDDVSFYENVQSRMRAIHTALSEIIVYISELGNVKMVFHKDFYNHNRRGVSGNE